MTPPADNDFQLAQMNHEIVCYAASVGHSVWVSRDLGESWLRAPTPTGGIYNESRCWSLATHPARPDEVWSGTDQGIYVWRHSLARWNYLPSPMDGLHILKLARSPSDPDFIVAGTRPAEIFVSRDGGRSWQCGELPIGSECWFINTPRVTSIQFDPKEPETLWVMVEIAGIFRSRDGGKNWELLVEGLRDPDVHNLVIMDDHGDRVILCATEVGLHRSADNGASWEFQEVPAAGDLVYFRCMARRADQSGVIFMSIGDKPSGETGVLLRSRDFGATWEPVELPGRVNTTIWWIFANPEDPRLILCNSIFGEIFRSTDGGETWQRMDRFLGEIREIAWQAVPRSEPGISEQRS